MIIIKRKIYLKLIIFCFLCASLSDYFVFSNEYLDIRYIDPNSKQYYELCEAAKDEVWDYTYKRKKQEFLEFVDYASNLILTTENNMIGAPSPKEWEMVFRKAQLGWIEQLELDRESYFFSESGLGGNGNARDSVRFAVRSLESRINELKSLWWVKSFANFKTVQGRV